MLKVGDIVYGVTRSNNIRQVNEYRVMRLDAATKKALIQSIDKPKASPLWAPWDRLYATAEAAWEDNANGFTAASSMPVVKGETALSTHKTTINHQGETRQQTTYEFKTAQAAVHPSKQENRNWGRGGWGKSNWADIKAEVLAFARSRQVAVVPPAEAPVNG